MTVSMPLDRRQRRRQETIEQVLDVAVEVMTEKGVAGLTLALESAFVRWAVEHPGHAPLMLWPPVPGFTPSEQAYEPAVELAELVRGFLAGLREGGFLPRDADLDLAYRTLTAVISGVISQQLSNAPGEPFDTGTFTSTLPDVLAMWLQLGAPRSPVPD